MRIRISPPPVVGVCITHAYVIIKYIVYTK